jgi:hypothetical protein
VNADTEFPDALVIGMQAAVPLHIMEVRGLPFRERHRLARDAATVVASQGDTLMYGSGTARFGHGTKEQLRHQAHGSAKAEACATCEQGKDSARCCMRRFRDTCRVCLTGQPHYSAGEVFNHLARGVAILACQPGGVTFAGLHWCAYPHPCCPRLHTARRPGCCTCTSGCLLVTPCETPPPDSQCNDGCPFCANGCLAASDGQACCTTTPPPPEQDPPLSDHRPVERVIVAGDAL